NGAWGVLSLGLFADGTYGDGLNGVAGGVRGLLYGDPSQFLVQMIGTLACFEVMDAVMGIRVSAEVVLEGLDVPEMGGHGYPEIQGPSTVVHLPATATRMVAAIAPEPGR